MKITKDKYITHRASLLIERLLTEIDDEVSEASAMFSKIDSFKDAGGANQELNKIEELFKKEIIKQLKE